MRSRVTQQLQRILSQSISAEIPRTKGLLAVEEKRTTPTIPVGFSPHDYAVFLLQVAAEIEHGLLIQYLFAAYSLGGPQVPEDQRDAVRKWQGTLLGIAREEMGHLVTVQNLLKLIGGALNLERNDFPWDVPFYPFPFALEPVTPALLARYVCIESPEVWPTRWAAHEQAIKDVAFPPDGVGFKRVGLIYNEIRKLLSDKELMPDALFHADTLSYQASFAEWGRGYAAGARGAVSAGDAVPDVLIYTAYSRSTALDALKAVAEQGEAADLDTAKKSPSHFERFMELYEEISAASLGWNPCRPVVSNPRAIGDPDSVPGTTYLAHQPSRRWAQLLNLRYRMLLTYMNHSFRISGDDGPTGGLARGAVLNRAFGEMYNLRAISNFLVTLPANDDGGPERAAPSFELPYSLSLPFLERDVWRLHIDLLQACSPLIAELKGSLGNAGDAYLESLQAVDAKAIATFETTLRSGCSLRAVQPQGGQA